MHDPLCRLMRAFPPDHRKFPIESFFRRRNQRKNAVFEGLGVRHACCPRNQMSFSGEHYGTEAARDSVHPGPCGTPTGGCLGHRDDVPAHAVQTSLETREPDAGRSRVEVHGNDLVRTTRRSVAARE